jgi:hypothetical protein
MRRDAPAALSGGLLQVHGQQQPDPEISWLLVSKRLVKLFSDTLSNALLQIASYLNCKLLDCQASVSRLNSDHPMYWLLTRVGTGG